MGNLKSNDATADRSAETRLRGGSDVERTSQQQSQNTDQVLRTDGEEDTLYDDGLELEDSSRPLKGINGKDDT